MHLLLLGLAIAPCHATKLITLVPQKQMFVSSVTSTHWESVYYILAFAILQTEILTLPLPHLLCSFFTGYHPGLQEWTVP